MTDINNNFRVKNGIEVATSATIGTSLHFSDNTVQTTAYTGTGTLVANAVNAEVAAYATTFNTSTLVAVAVDVINGVGIPLITAAETTATTTATGKLVSISDTGGKLAYYNDTTSTWLYVGTEAAVYAPPDPNAPPVAGYIAWYDVSSVNLGTATWTDKTGNGYNGTITGSPTIVSETGNGSTATFDVLSGGTSDWVNFPSAILPPYYTFFHVDRYSGSNRGRFFSQSVASPPYWISGHYNNIAGFAYRDGTVNPSYVDYGTNWVISADQNYFYRPNGNTAAQGTSGNGASATSINLNGYTYESGQQSDWQCAEIVVYNRTLDSTEIAATEAWLAAKYGITLGV